MAYEAILQEVDLLNLAGDRIEGVAVHHPSVTEALIAIAGTVRSSATVLVSLVETKLRDGGHIPRQRNLSNQ